jgi:hypothetical protein
VRREKEKGKEYGGEGRIQSTVVEGEEGGDGEMVMGRNREGRRAPLLKARQREHPEGDGRNEGRERFARAQSHGHSHAPAQFSEHAR